MPLPPDYEPTKQPRQFKLPLPEDWVFLLVVGIICVGVSGGDLNNIGQQITGASLTAFTVKVKGKDKPDA